MRVPGGEFASHNHVPKLWNAIDAYVTPVLARPSVRWIFQNRYKYQSSHIYQFSSPALARSLLFHAFTTPFLWHILLFFPIFLSLALLLHFCKCDDANARTSKQREIAIWKAFFHKQRNRMWTRKKMLGTTTTTPAPTTAKCLSESQ